MRILLLFLFTLNAQAQVKILNFNTMCDFCHGSDFFKYDERLKKIAKLIQKTKPDLLSLQELRSTSQIEEIIKLNPEYDYIATEYTLVSYADPAILYNKNKFKLIGKKNLWIGPKKGNFTFGWKAALPRQILVAKFQYQEHIFNFLSSHFDNQIDNLKSSAKFFQEFIKELKEPFIFAADTNIPLDMPEYEKMSSGLVNAFDIKESFAVRGVYTSDKDICYTKKGKVFPTCRVEHILMNTGFPWRVKSFVIDAEDKTLSDHRPIFVEIEFPKVAPQSSL
jgi:endonuclease/exonuclease/phosphatase family metal-dependent hydrolase